MTFFYSKDTNGFYLSPPAGLDVVEISEADHASLMDGQVLGKVIVADSSGLPALKDPPLITVGAWLEFVKSSMRELRAPMLDALSGIAGRAQRAGNAAMAAEADELSQHLLDITNDTALNSATTYDEMKSSGLAAFNRIAASASPALSSVFRDLENHQ